MAEGLAVGGRVHEPAAVRGACLEEIDQPLGRARRPVECDRVADVAVVEHDGQVATRSVGVLDAVGDRRVERLFRRRLARGEDREGHALLDQHVDGPLVRGRLRQPDSLGPAAEPQLEVAQPPADLRPDVAHG
jgi:hypothetical protein